jgi:hypothetical protein
MGDDGVESSSLLKPHLVCTRVQACVRHLLQDVVLVDRGGGHVDGPCALAELLLQVAQRHALLLRYHLQRQSELRVGDLALATLLQPGSTSVPTG